MTTSSSYIGLTLYNNTTDTSASFITWQQDMSGSVNSNMTKIDAWAGSASGSISGLNTSFSGSMVLISGSIANISSSLVSLQSQIISLGLRLEKLAEFSGAGQADFNNISGSYTHLIIMGMAAGNAASNNVDLGCDFNGDANSANYESVQWHRHGPSPDVEFFSQYAFGALTIGNIPGNLYPGYGGSVFVVLPNYSGSAGFYKTGMGISAFYNTKIHSAIQGGTWKNTSPITRIRLFSLYGSSARLDFLPGTKLTLYGFGG